MKDSLKNNDCFYFVKNKFSDYTINYFTSFYMLFCYIYFSQFSRKTTAVRVTFNYYSTIDRLLLTIILHHTSPMSGCSSTVVVAPVQTDPDLMLASLLFAQGGEVLVLKMHLLINQICSSS
jgi:hypothetical protein